MSGKEIKIKAERVPAKWAQAARDIDALAAFEPRAKAIGWLVDGQIGQALGWLAGDCFVAATGLPAPKPAPPLMEAAMLLEPIKLDSALFFKRRAPGPDGVAFTVERAIECVDCFCMSPLEILIRRASPEVFKSALGMLSTPELKMRASFRPITAKWVGRSFREWAAAPGFDQPAQPDEGRQELLVLAALLGKFEHAEAMIKAGFAPEDPYGWASLLDLGRLVLDASPGDRLAVFGIEDGVDIQAGWNWLSSKDDLSTELEQACQAHWPLRDKATADERAQAVAKLAQLVDKGAAAGSYALFSATQWNEAALLRAMFAAGANPNCRCKSGGPMLGRIKSDWISAEALQAWLDAGADPACSSGFEHAIDDGGIPSSLLQWTRDGNLDLMRQAAKRSRGPVVFKFTHEGKTYSPMLAAALRENHQEIAQWLIQECGCRLDHFATDAEARCSSFASGALREMASSWEERSKLRGDKSVKAGAVKAGRAISL